MISPQKPTRKELMRYLKIALVFIPLLLCAVVFCVSMVAEFVCDELYSWANQS